MNWVLIMVLLILAVSAIIGYKQGLVADRLLAGSMGDRAYVCGMGNPSYKPVFDGKYDDGRETDSIL